MQTSGVAAQTGTILAPVVCGGASVAQGVATRVLGEMISQCLSRSAEGREAWYGSRSNPHDDFLVRHLLSGRHPPPVPTACPRSASPSCSGSGPARTALHPPGPAAPRPPRKSLCRHRSRQCVNHLEALNSLELHRSRRQVTPRGPSVGFGAEPLSGCLLVFYEISSFDGILRDVTHLILTR